MRKTFYEFFAGIGLVRLGLEPVGWQCIWANDISAQKLETYRLNFEDDHYLLEDIWNVSSSTIPGGAFLATASFPCTDLSLAGDRAGLNGSESSTYFAFVRLLKQLRNEGRIPPVVMLENVDGLLTSHGGKDIAAILESLAALGYYVDIIELDATHFVPQSRRRIFIFGLTEGIARSVMVIRDDTQILGDWRVEIDSNPSIRPSGVVKVMKKNPDFPWGALVVSSPPTLRKKLADLLEQVPDDSNLWWPKEKRDRLRSQMSAKHELILVQMMSQAEYSYGTIYRRVRKTGSMAELRTDGISGCLRTPKGGSSKQILLRAGKGSFSVRWMTPREYARLQGVPDWFSLPNDTNQALFGLGDAVCVPAISWIAENILDICFEAWITQPVAATI